MSRGKATYGRPKKKTEEEIQRIGVLMGRDSKLKGFKIHLSLKEKLDSYDKNYENDLDPKRYHHSDAIVIRDGSIKFPKLSKKFYTLKKWSLQDYLVYYHYMTNQSRIIESIRGDKKIRLTEGNINLEEKELLEKLSKGLFNIEKIIAEHYINNCITYDKLVGDLDVEIPINTIVGMISSNGNSSDYRVSDYIK